MAEPTQDTATEEDAAGLFRAHAVRAGYGQQLSCLDVVGVHEGHRSANGTRRCVLMHGGQA